ncbi:MAG: 16S rRNA (adenine(1518)-N(6)/adenine(1519)-N(6))-dimethyltransferase RsmA [Bacteroidota bacterium]
MNRENNRHTGRPKKSLGQHFLIDMNIARKIVGALHGSEAANIIEIGPGKGVLTKFLLERFGEKLHVVEIDSNLAAGLAADFPELGNRIVQADILKAGNELYQPSSAIIGNLPYNISSQIFFRVLENRDSIPEMVCMIQKEVADRIRASHGSKTYGILSVLIQAFYIVEFLFPVSEKVFSPPPKVKSAVIRLTRSGDLPDECNDKLFFTIVKAAFNHRRKTMRNSLKSFIPEDISGDGIFNLRPEQLSVREFISLTNMLSDFVKR